MRQDNATMLNKTHNHIGSSQLEHKCVETSIIIITVHTNAPSKMAGQYHTHLHCLYDS